MLGQDFVLVASPAAQAALVKQAPYLPKPQPTYSPFNALARVSELICTAMCGRACRSAMQVAMHSICQSHLQCEFSSDCLRALHFL